MINKTQTEASASRKTIQNHEVEKLMQELNGKARAGILLREYEILLAKAKRVSEKLKDSTILEKAVISVGEKLIKIGSKEQANRNTRISSLETALKLLFDFYGKQKNEQSVSTAVVALIARACYERSVLILSKQDKVMVEKKKRIIKKGVEFAEKAVAKESNNKDALRLRCMLLLELEKVDKDNRDVSDLKEALSCAIENGCIEFDQNADDIEIALRFAEFVKEDGGGKPLSEDICESLKNIVDSSLQTKDIELKKAKAYYLLGNDTEVINCMKSFIGRLSSLELSFSDPAWSAAAGFVGEFEKAGKDCWKKIALMVWDVCKKRYEESSTVEQYWYFGHLMSHYYIADLAFAAQDDLEKKVEIADFLKSKILLHGQALDDEAEKFWEYNKDARQQRFIKSLEMVYETEKKRTSGANQRGFKEIPNDCVVVHFYLNKLKKKGYAILAYSDRKWEIKEFPYVNLFEAFISWQTNYCVNYPAQEMPEYRRNAAKYLLELCKEIDSTMPFLFKIYFNKHILFIPNDFLNRLPLHGALDDRNNIFLQKHESCSYLPAWSLAPQNKGKGQKESEKQIEKRLLKYFEDHDYAELKNDVAWNSQEDPATPEHLLNGYMPPGVLTVLSHGMADVVNSFNAKLMLNGGDVTNFDIMKHPSLRLDGSHVILGCCEGDLLPPLSAALDEHLSIASAFLFKGATAVLCTMWETNPKEIENIALELCKNDIVWSGTFDTLQKRKLSIWKEVWEKKQNPLGFYYTIVFKMVGVEVFLKKH